MPISEYFGGNGTEVMKEMKAKHGEKAGERIFYATANAKGQKPAEDAESEFFGEEGMKTVVRPRSDGKFAVALIDTDSGETVGIKIYSTREGAEAAAKALASGRAADRRARLHAALDCVMDRRGYGKATKGQPRIEDAEFHESEHPRGKGEHGGEFVKKGSGGGGSSEGGEEPEQKPSKSRAAKLSTAPADRKQWPEHSSRAEAQEALKRMAEKAGGNLASNGNWFDNPSGGGGWGVVQNTRKPGKFVIVSIPGQDSAYRLTARDDGFLRSLLEHGTELVKGGLGALAPGDAGQLKG